MRRRPYPRDPYWLTARYPGVDHNGHPFPAGARVFYYPNTREFLQGSEAMDAARDFDAHRFDESVYQYGK